VIHLTAATAQQTDLALTMSYTEWLRRQVSRLEGEIRAHSVFDTDVPATAAELKALRAKVVIHTYLKQQLLRRETIVTGSLEIEEYDTQEFVLVRR
jgi:hypothetical protein